MITCSGKVARNTAGLSIHFFQTAYLSCKSARISQEVQSVSSILEVVIAGGMFDAGPSRRSFSCFCRIPGAECLENGEFVVNSLRYVVK